MGNPYYLSRRFLESKTDYFVKELVADLKIRRGHGWQTSKITISRGSSPILEEIAETAKNEEFVLGELTDPKSKDKREVFYRVVHRGYGERFAENLKLAIPELEIEVVDSIPEPRQHDRTTELEKAQWTVDTDKWFGLYDRTFRDYQFIQPKEKVRV